MMFASPGEFVKLGRRFWSRTHTEFGIQTGGRYPKPPGTFAYDPNGQDGTPVWFSIRRSGGAFQAFHSLDGVAWKPIGSELKAPDRMLGAKLGVYAMQEAVGEPSATVE